MTVIIQAGHEHTQSNCEQGIRSSTGAPGEITWTPDISDRVVAILRQAGVDARHVDANFNCTADARRDWEAVVAVHYQADLPTQSGFFCGTGNPATDGAADKSARLRDHVRDAYAAATGLPERPGWNNPNITEYYLYNSLSGPTPFVLIECGVGAPGAPDHDFLYNQRDRVAGGIAAGILGYLGKAAPAPVPPHQGQLQDRVELRTAVVGPIFPAAGATTYHWQSLPTVSPVGHVDQGVMVAYTQAVLVDGKWYDRIQGTDQAVLDDDIDTAVDGHATDPAYWRAHQAPPPAPTPAPPPEPKADVAAAVQALETAATAVEQALKALGH